MRRHADQERSIMGTIGQDGSFQPHSWHPPWVWKALRRLVAKGLITRDRHYVLTAKGREAVEEAK